MRAWAVVALLLLGGCGFEHCIKVDPRRDDNKAALAEAQCSCRCPSPENYDPIKSLKTPHLEMEAAPPSPAKPN